MDSKLHQRTKIHTRFILDDCSVVINFTRVTSSRNGLRSNLRVQNVDCISYSIHTKICFGCHSTFIGIEFSIWGN